MDADLIFALFRALSEHGVAYKVIGGVAVNLQGHARMTEDLDIFVHPGADKRPPTAGRAPRRLRRPQHRRDPR